MASDFFTTFAASVPLWLLPLVLLVYVWGKIVRSGLDPDKPESFQRTMRWLREDRLGELYLKTLGWLMDKVSSWIGDKAQLNRVFVTTATSRGVMMRLCGFNSLTAASYEICLRLAFLYPVLAYLLAWVLGGDGQVGGGGSFTVEANNIDLYQRGAIVGAILVITAFNLWLISSVSGWKIYLFFLIAYLLFLYIGIELESHLSSATLTLLFFGLIFMLFGSLCFGGWIGSFLIKNSGGVPIEVYRIAVVFSASGAIAFCVSLVALDSVNGQVAHAALGCAIAAIVVAIVGPKAIVAVLAITLAGNISDSLSGWSISVAMFVAGLTTAVLSNIQQWSKSSHKLFSFWVLYTLVILILSYVGQIVDPNQPNMVLLLFWILLPLVNAPLDWVSLGVTRGLLQAVRAGQHSGWVALGWAFADLLLALLFLFLITATLVGVTALGNTVSGRTLVDINATLVDMKNAPNSVNHWWIYFMLLSTLVPTLIHFALAGGAATLWLPRKLRLSIANGLEKDTYKTHMAWAYLTLTPVIGFILVPATLLYSLWWLVNVNGGWLGLRLLDWAQWLATTANPGAM